MSESCPAPWELAALAAGGLEDALAEPLRVHLDVCSDCAMAVALAAQSEDVSPPEAEPGDTIADRYRLEAKVGSGAMAVVWAATDLRLERRVALKLVRAASGADAEAMARRLVRESKAMARLRHPNVITVHDAGSLAEGVYIAMELVDGVNLRRWLRTKTRRRNEVVDVLRDAGRGLAAAHEAGLVHRDFKPDNVLVDRGGVGLVGDFGLVHLDGEEQAEEGRVTDELPLVDLERLTSTGVVLGTPAYMAPEQFEAGVVGAAADVFAFCVTIWEALSGERPFVGRTLEALRSNVEQGRIEGTVPRGLRRLLRAGLSVDPTARPSDVRTIVAALDRYESRHARWVGWGVGVTAMTIGVGLLAADAEPSCPPLPTRWDALRSETARVLAEALSPGRADAVVSRADEYAAAVAASWSEACRADAQDERRDAMLSCVRGRARSLDRIAILAETDAEQAERATGHLPRLSRCVSTGIAVDRPLPSEPALREAAAELWAEHDELLLRIEAGPNLDAVDEAKDFIARTEALGYAPLIATAKWLHAVGMARRSDPGTKDALIDAAWTASGAGFDYIAARAWTQLVSICHDPLRDFERGHEYAGNAQALLDRIRDQTDVRFIEIHLLKEHGLVYEAEGKLEQGRALLEAAIEMAEGYDVDLRDDTREALAMLAASEGNLEEAGELYRLVLDARSERYPADHPHVALAHMNLGANMFESAQYEAALEQMIAARDGFAAAYGDDHIEVFNARFNVGQCLVELGRLDEADVELAAAQAELERLGTLPLRLVWVLESRAGNLASTDADEALRLIDAATEILGEALESEDPEIARHHITKAEVLLAANHAAEALASAERAVGLVGGLADLQRIYMPAAQLLLGRALLANERYGDAVDPLEKALSGYGEQEVTRGLEHFVQSLLAEALWQTGQRERATMLAREAMAGLRAPHLAGEREMFEAWAARVGLVLE